MAEIITRYITKNPYFNDGKWITGGSFDGFFLHSVVVGQPDPMVFIARWDSAGYTNAGGYKIMRTTAATDARDYHVSYFVIGTISTS